jgi:hypothetical protein
VPFGTPFLVFKELLHLIVKNRNKYQLSLICCGLFVEIVFAHTGVMDKW